MWDFIEFGRSFHCIIVYGNKMSTWTISFFDGNILEQSLMGTELDDETYQNMITTQALPLTLIRVMHQKRNVNETHRIIFPRGRYST